MNQDSTKKSAPFYDVRNELAKKGKTKKKIWSVTLSTDNPYLRDEVEKRLDAMKEELKATFNTPIVNINVSK